MILDVTCEECGASVAGIDIDNPKLIQKVEVICPACTTVLYYGHSKRKIDELKPHDAAQQTLTPEPEKKSRKKKEVEVPA